MGRKRSTGKGDGSTKSLGWRQSDPELLFAPHNPRIQQRGSARSHSFQQQEHSVSSAFPVLPQPRCRCLPASSVCRGKVHSGSWTTAAPSAGRTQHVSRLCRALRGPAVTPEPAVAWLYPQNSPVRGRGPGILLLRTAEVLQSPPCPWHRITSTPARAWQRRCRRPLRGSVGPSPPNGPTGFSPWRFQLWMDVYTHKLCELTAFLSY